MPSIANTEEQEKLGFHLENQFSWRFHPRLTLTEDAAVTAFTLLVLDHEL
jgi:hypothetical protein